MRTQDEIVARMKVVGEDDLLGFQREVLLTCLDFPHAKEFLRPTVTEGEWQYSPTTPEDMKREALAYLDFAWEKCINHRGISANRSVQKLAEWLWLLGDTQLFKAFEAAPYPQYGAPKLKVLSLAWGAPMPDNEKALRMMNSEACEPGCSGCAT